MEVLVFGPCDQLEGLECCLVEEQPADSTKPAACSRDGDFSKTNHFLNRLRKRLGLKPKDSSSVETASTATSSTAQSSVGSVCKANHSVNGVVPLIQRRLLNMGVRPTDFEFVQDRVSKEVIDLQDTSDVQQLEDVTHVKTGIWQVTKLQDDGTPQIPFYVVTGVTMDDTVDTKKLRKVLFAGETNQRRPKLAMADTSIAEQLVGFRSGTMAPICHTKPMKLYLEESIVNDAKSNPAHRINVGSGMFGKCLSIDLDAFLKVAQSNSYGMELVSIKKNSKQSKQ